MVRLKPLDQQVLVITGASSGIGLATARAAVRAGAAVVLAARDTAELAHVEAELVTGGGRVVTVTADVSDPADVERIVHTASSAFGGFDTWVNNAGVSMYGTLLQTPLQDHRQLFEVNYWGVVHGSLAAARRLSSNGGAIINVGSIESDRALPLQGAYAASKHAVRAFTDTLRMEIEREGLPISITLVKPGAIDTPLFQHARSYLEHSPASPPPAYRPQEVARTILHCATRPVRELTVGGAGRLLTWLGAAAPRLSDRDMRAALFEGQQRRDHAGPRAGNLYEPAEPHLERGTAEGVLPRSADTRLALAGVGRTAAWAMLGVAAAALIAARGRS